MSKGWGRRPGWTEDELRDAIANSRSWYGVARRLGLKHGGHLLGPAMRLHIDYSHLLLPPRTLRCTGPACDRPTGGAALCAAHRNQRYSRGYLTPLRPAQRDGGRSSPEFEVDYSLKVLQHYRPELLNQDQEASA